MKISELWGPAVSVNPQQTELFVKTWFHPEDWVTVGILPQSSEQKPLWMTWTAEGLAEISAEGLQELQDGIEGLYGLYVVVNPVKVEAQIHPNGSSSKGGTDAIRETYGLFLDLDVKVGGFESQDQAIQFLDRLEVKPTMIVRNGEGGIHAWFRCDGATQDDMKAFHAYAEDKAGVRIDRLINLDRVLRLPGGIRYDKGSPRSGAVEIIGGSGQKVDLEKVRTISAESYKRHKAVWAETKRRNRTAFDKLARLSREELSKSNPDISWSTRIALHKIERHVEEMDWADILVPLGWTQCGSGNDGKRLWARPGQSGQSGNTDWKGSGVLSLHSMSEDTGLSDLKAAEVPLTKMVVLLRLWFNDDAALMIKNFYNIQGE